jgi:hypothetical protein
MKACTCPDQTTCGPQNHRRPTPITAGDVLADGQQDRFEGRSIGIVDHARPAQCASFRPRGLYAMPMGTIQRRRSVGKMRRRGGLSDGG